LDEGNPNVASLQKQINDKLVAEGLVDIKFSYSSYNSKFTNQDNNDIEGLAHWIMVLEFTQVKTWNYDIKIYNVIKEMYLWIAMFFKNKI
jgi:hypothetical protein